jgi:hypothetical protein
MLLIFRISTRSFERVTARRTKADRNLGIWFRDILNSIWRRMPYPTQSWIAFADFTRPTNECSKEWSLLRRSVTWGSQQLIIGQRYVWQLFRAAHVDEI